MNFFSVPFVGFLIIVFVINWILDKRYRYLWLLSSGYVFYALWDLRYLFVLLLVTLISYISAIVLARKRSGYVLALSIVLILSVLCIFKFWNFWTDGMSVLFGAGSMAPFSVVNIIAPVGLSFYVLTSLGYVIDVYREKSSPEYNFGRYALFVSFFPAVLSGPIERSDNLLSQIRAPREYDYDNVKKGLLLIFWGYYMKLLIANRLAVIVDGAFDFYHSKTGMTMLIAVVLYGFQLYTDFAGYSYIAMGIGKLLGFDLVQNFRQPYLSDGIRDFWNRWHVSLSSWLRDYIYIPLGGNRKGKLRKAINLFVTFLVSGIWHGAGLQFVFWGILHGFYQIISGLFGRRKSENNNKVIRVIKRSLRCIITFVLVDFAWLFFRAGYLCDGFEILRKIVFELHFLSTITTRLFLTGYGMSRLIFTMGELFIVFIVDVLVENKVDLYGLLNKQKKPVRWCIYLVLAWVLIFGILYDYGLDSGAFLYTRF